MAEVVAEIPGEAAGLQTEVIVVVDGSTRRHRGRAAAAARWSATSPSTVARAPRCGSATGWPGPRGAVIATIDADGQYEPEELARVVEPILAGHADFVSGSRRLGAELTTDRVRHAGVLVFGALFSVLIRHRITDPACGLRAMRAEVTAAVTLEQPQYQASELMISAALNGFRLAEVPTTMRDRGAAGRTKKDGNLRYGVRFARAALDTWRRDRKAARTRLRPEKIQCS